MVADQVNVWVGRRRLDRRSPSPALGAMSLVVGRLAGAGLSALLFLHYSPLPYRVRLRPATVARACSRFGLPLAGASIIVFLVGFVDQLVVGHLLGAVAARLLRAGGQPRELAGQRCSPSRCAAWRRRSSPGCSTTRALMRSRSGSCCGRSPRSRSRGLRESSPSPPPTSSASSTARSGCRPAPILRWLALLAAMRILFELAYDFLVVLGRSATILRLQVVWIVVLVPAVWIGIERGERPVRQRPWSPSRHWWLPALRHRVPAGVHLAARAPSPAGDAPGSDDHLGGDRRGDRCGHGRDVRDARGHRRGDRARVSSEPWPGCATT